MTTATKNSSPDSRMLFLLVLAAGFVFVGFLNATPEQIFSGIYRINFGPCQLFSDFVVIGGFGATLVNVASVILLEIAIIKWTNTTITGTHLSAIFTTGGFALFGTNLFNMIPIIVGVFLYARLQKTALNTLLLQAFFGSAIGPLISFIAFSLGLDPAVGVILGFLVGVVVGLIISPLSSAFLRFHQGYNLYNIGFTAGMIGLVAVACMKLFNISVEPLSILDTEHGFHLTLFALAIFLSLLIFGLVLNRWNLRDYPRLLKNSGRLLADFVLLYGPGLTFFNMGLMGLISLGLLKIINAPINGPIIGAIMTIAGFAAMGKHPRNTLPVMAGASLAALLHGDIRSVRSLITILFSTTIAPLSGQFGLPIGILAGYLHTAVVSHVLPLHGGLNLYNNGFSGGFVAALMVPLIEAFNQIREGKNHENS